ISAINRAASRQSGEGADQNRSIACFQFAYCRSMTRQRQAHGRRFRPLNFELACNHLDPQPSPATMLTLYSYPSLFGVADNNGYGLKVFAFLRLAGVPFQHEHIFDASAAPRGPLPYIVDGNDTVGDSETIIGFVTQKYRLTIDAALSLAQRTTNLLITRILDDLYWVMSYSRWQDERFWPAFRAALLREHPSLTEEGLAKAKAFNHQRYYYQGIGRFDPDAAMARGVVDLEALGAMLPSPGGYVHGERPTSIDAAIYGFIANIYFYDIDTPLKQCVLAHENIVWHCCAMHEAISLEDE